MCQNFIGYEKSVLKNIYRELDTAFLSLIYKGSMMDKQEIAVINQKVKEYKDFRQTVFERIEVLIKKIQNAKFNNDKKNKIISNLSEIRSSLGNVFLHYEEIGFAKTIKQDVEKLINAVDHLTDMASVDETINKVEEIKDLIERYSKIKEQFKELTINALTPTIQEVNDELSSFRRLRSISDSALTESIYNNAVTKYRGLEEKYRGYFYKGIGVVLSIAIILLILKQFLAAWFSLNTIEFWILKVSILAVGITLITYFLKQSAHYQRLADQNYQTQVELQAYPSFMESIPSNEAASVRKELALKYFGRELDGSIHKDMSNLVSEQMKSTTEMVKAATDILKTKSAG